MALVEIGFSGIKTPKDLQGFTSRHGDISVVVFTKRDKTDNAQISAFLEAGADDFISPEITTAYCFPRPARTCGGSCPP